MQFEVVEAWDVHSLKSQMQTMVNTGYFPHGYPTVVEQNGQLRFYHFFVKNS